MDDDSDAEEGAAKTAVGQRTKASLPVSIATLRYAHSFLLILFCILYSIIQF